MNFYNFCVEKTKCTQISPDGTRGSLARRNSRRPARRHRRRLLSADRRRKRGSWIMLLLLFIRRPKHATRTPPLVHRPGHRDASLHSGPPRHTTADFCRVLLLLWLGGARLRDTNRHHRRPSPSVPVLDTRRTLVAPALRLVVAQFAWTLSGVVVVPPKTPARPR